jgi:transcriptional regulator with XRE-family HTH domain
MTHNELIRKALNRKSVKAEYEALEPEFTILKALLSARHKAGLSQAEIAKRMGTKPPAITRLESSLTSGKHSPSIATLKKYAEVLGYHLEIRLVQNKIAA